jgi:hypothetical protein
LRGEDRIMPCQVLEEEIDKAIALLKPGHKRIEACESMRADFRGKLIAELVEELPRSDR